MKKMSIYYNNIRRLKSKLNKIKQIIKEQDPNIFILIETWINKGEKLNIEGNELYTSDREEQGGGIIVGVKDLLKNIAA